jgi:hypothetical protein
LKSGLPMSVFATTGLINSICKEMKTYLRR